MFERHSLVRLTALTALAALGALALPACAAAGGQVDGAPQGSPVPTAGPAASTTGAPAPPSVTVTAVDEPPPTTSTVPLRVEPADPATLAAGLTSAWRTILDPEASDAAVAEAGRSQQRLLRALARRPGWEDLVGALVPADVATFVANDLDARRAATVAARRRGAPPDTLPAWRIVEPRPVEELTAYYREAEAATGVGWHWLAAINLVETRMGRIVGLSTAGARGPMQFLATTWASCCEGDVDDPRDAILGAARYLVIRGAPHDMRAAVLGYNPSEPYLAMVSAYAANIAADERAYRGYHAWEVYVPSSAGDARLPVGYDAAEPLDAAAWLAAHPSERA